MNSSQRIAELREAAKQRWGARWIAPLAREARINERSLRTLLYRGKRLPPADRLEALEEAVGLRSKEPGSHDTHRCQFLDFTAMVADYIYMRRVVLALTGGRQERKRTEAILTEAQRLKKLEIEGGTDRCGG